MSSDYQITITRLLGNLKSGGTDTQNEALRRLMETYSTRLSQVARQLMSNRAKLTDDTQDVVQSVFMRLLVEVRAQAILDFHDSHDLWQHLISITRDRAIERTRRASRKKRGGDRIRADLIAEIASEEPTAEFVVALRENAQHLIAQLVDPTLQQVVLLKLELYSTEEIATKLSLSQRSIQRKLKEIKKEWEKYLDE